MENQSPNTKSILSTAGGGAVAPHLEERRGALREGVALSLTTYKEVVYNFAEYQKDYAQIQSNINRLAFKRQIWNNHSEKKIVYYGLTKKQGSSKL